jgi:hypothetical protein
MCAEIAPIEKQDKILEKMLILKYTLKTGVFSRFFFAFLLTFENRVAFLKNGGVFTMFSAFQFSLEDRGVFTIFSAFLFTLENRGVFH